MLHKLVKIANQLDRKGMYQEADEVDSIIRQAMDEFKPTEDQAQKMQEAVLNLAQMLGDLYSELGVDPEHVPQKVYEEFGGELESAMTEGRDVDDLVREISTREFDETREEMGLQKLYEEGGVDE